MAYSGAKDELCTIGMVHIDYHGWVGIDYWEYLVSVAYMFLLYLYFARVKNQKVKQFPEYANLIWGLYAKVLGGVFFALIYFFYYKGGDTLAYFYSAVSMSKLASRDPLLYLTALFGDNSPENRSFYDSETGWPFKYVYFDDNTFFVIRIVSIFAFLCVNSYLITTVVLSSISYIGVWRAYRMFVRYFPELRREMAVAFLFMPSCIFWGSAILKDTFTFSAVCFWVYSVDAIFYQKERWISHYVAAVLSAAVIIMVKPYIFMALMPVTLVWLFYFKFARIRSKLLKTVILPVLAVLLMVTSVLILQRLGDSLGKFSLDKAISTVEVIQTDMLRSEQYGSNYHDIGEFDGTWTGLLGKYPQATMAGLFRPFLWEARSAVMLLSGLENFWLLAMVIFAMFASGPVQMFRIMTSIPLVLMSMIFALMFAFIVGVTTPNFGAMVRFKIPLIPFFVSALYITRYVIRRLRRSRALGINVDPGVFALGSRGVVLPGDTMKTIKDVRKGR